MARGGARRGAGRKPGPTDSSDIAAFIDALRPVKCGRGGYRRIDRYRDFNRVLLATAEGKRVLSQIVDLCEGPIIAEDQLSNHALLAARAWSRRVGALISQYATVPPPDDEPDEKQVNKIK